MGTKVSALTSASAFDGTELVPVVQGGVTKKATIAQLSPSLPVIDVSTYGVASTNADNTTGLINAIAAAVALFNAGGPGATLYFPEAAEYLFGGALLTTNGVYAQIPLPIIEAATARKMALRFKGPGLASSNTPGTNQTATPKPTAILRSTLAYDGVGYSATYGWPSFFGGIDRAKGGKAVSWFSLLDIQFDGVIFRSPTNPWLCMINCQTISSVNGVDSAFDTTAAYGSIVYPTRPTGVSVLPSTDLNNTAVFYKRVMCLGYFGGIPLGEHMFAEWLYTVRCAISHPIVEALHHAVTVVHTVTEEQTYVIAGLDPVAGVIDVPGGSGARPTVVFHNLDIEDRLSGSSWNMALHIKDGADNLRGRIRHTRVVPGAQASPSALTVSGTSPAYMVDDLLSTTGFVVPTPATVAGVPTSFAAAPASGQMALSWVAPVSTGGSTIADYSIQYKATASGTWLVWAHTPSTTAAATITGLTDGTSYDFRVAAINGVGTGTYATATATPTSITAPGAPTSVAATASDTAANVSWVAPASNGGSAITGYTITASPGGATVSAAPAQTAAYFPGLTNGTAYTFAVTATNAAGTGTAGTSGSVTPDVGAVTVDLADTFTRADGASLGGPETGNAPTIIGTGAAVGILSNQARVTGGTGYVGALYDVGSSQGVLSYDVISAAAPIDITMFLCAAAASDTLMLEMISTTNVQLYKRVAGTFTSLATGTGGAFTPSSSHTFKVTISGKTITVTLDGVTVLTHTLSAANATTYLGNTKVGFGVQVVGNYASVRWDNLSFKH